MKFILIPADVKLPIQAVEFEGNGYDKARELVGGYIQLVQVQGYKKLDMCVDEDGKVFGKFFNIRATIVAAIGQDIVGDVVITGKNFADVDKVAPYLIEQVNSERFHQEEKRK